MDNKRLFAILLGTMLVIVGCLSPFVHQNRQNITKLQSGMTKAEVYGVMGTKSAGNYSNPHRSAMYMDGNTPVEVLFYWTDGSVDGGVSSDELTPVVLRDGHVAGWGREFWMEYVRKYEIRMR